MGSVIRFSIRHPGVIIGLAFIIIAYGIYQIKQSPLNVFPEFSPTQVIIQTEAPGFSSNLVETVISKPIEQAISGTIGIKQTRSQSIPGLSVVTVIFEENTDIHQNRQAVSESLSKLIRVLPTGIIPTIAPLTSSASSVLGIGIYSESKTLSELRTVAETLIIPQLISVSGVADVNRFGGKVRQLHIEIIPQKLYQYSISIGDILQAVKNSTLVMGGGYIENANQRIIINTDGQSKTINEIEIAPIKSINNNVIKIRDVANVKESFEPSISAASINGKPGVYLSVQGQLNADTYKLTQQLESALKLIEPLLKNQNIEIIPDLFKPSNFIDASIKGLRIDIIIGAFFVISILYLFLFNFKTAFISAVAIPLSLLSAISVMSYFNFGLNVMVISGLAIALGEVVDDAIIDVENIFRRMRQNKQKKQPLPLYQVVFNSSMEVRKSVVFATVIIVLVFLPLLSLSGVAGKLFGPLAIAYISSITASLFVALTITPALCYLMIGYSDIKVEDSPVVSFLKKKYEIILLHIEKQSKLIIFSSLFIIAIGLSFLPFLKTQFIPPLHEGHFIMHMTSFPGTSEQESIRVGNLVTKKLEKIEGIKSIAQWVGRSPLGADTFGTHYSEFEIELDKGLGGPEQDQILEQMKLILHGDKDQEFEEGFVGVNFAINTFLTERIEETISGYNASVVINLYGENLDLIDQDAALISATLNSIDGIKDITLQSPPGSPEVFIKLRSEKMSSLGINKADVLKFIRAAYDNYPVTKIYNGIIPTTVAVTLNKSSRDNILDIKKLPIKNAQNQIIQLSEIADIAQKNGRSKILHQNGKRVQTVTANIGNVDINIFTKNLKEKLKDIKLNPGNYYEITGAAQENMQARNELITQSLLAGGVVLLLLYIAFGSFTNLCLTVLNLPFALIGGVLAATFTGGWISIGSLVGFVTLFGITLRNTIMLISHYQYLINEENCIWNAKTSIRGAKERLPSILMTALVAGLALTPIAFGSDQPGKEIEGPMAMIIIGGLFTSTILNLLILPTILLNYGTFKKLIQR
ncbi:MAG: efflux RND transporter permease subunit [Nitrosomonadales bacterium]|nr:efflux RND transporter permease subunit [Nitrosomonadales bacterium]MBT7482309.1 efflux RND transporter permease subunit [Nitrosomonadales bacterium]